jgi:hypothetical protein
MRWPRGIMDPRASRTPRSPQPQDVAIPATASDRPPEWPGGVGWLASLPTARTAGALWAIRRDPRSGQPGVAEGQDADQGGRQKSRTCARASGFAKAPSSSRFADTPPQKTSSEAAVGTGGEFRGRHTHLDPDGPGPATTPWGEVNGYALTLGRSDKTRGIGVFPSYLYPLN